VQPRSKHRLFRISNLSGLRIGAELQGAQLSRAESFGMRGQIRYGHGLKRVVLQQKCRGICVY